MDFAIQGSRPIWQQLTEQLARRIITGAYPLGARFPAVRELAAGGRQPEHDAARDHAPRNALGLVTTNRTLGRTVTENAGALEEMRRRLAVECTGNFSRKWGAGLFPARRGYGAGGKEKKNDE